VLNEKDMGIAAAQQILSRIQMPEQPQREIIICNQYAVSITPQ
jgi:LacI family transcriptional regulator